MRRYRKTWIFLLMIVFVIQFIQPKKNTSNGIGENDISKVYAIPSDVHQTLAQKCYDCHSNNTRYPWCYNVQPIGRWLPAHVYGGKKIQIFQNSEPTGKIKQNTNWKRSLRW